MNVNVCEHPEHDIWILEGSKPALTLCIYAWGQHMWPNFQKCSSGLASYDKYFDSIESQSDRKLYLSQDGPNGKIKLDQLVDMFREYGVFASFNGAVKEAVECVQS